MLGVLTALLPLTGFPGAWRSFFTFVFGVSIAILAFIAYKNGEVGEPAEKKENTFTENMFPLSQKDTTPASDTQKPSDIISSI